MIINVAMRAPVVLRGLRVQSFCKLKRTGLS